MVPRWGRASVQGRSYPHGCTAKRPRFGCYWPSREGNSDSFSERGCSRYYAARSTARAYTDPRADRGVRLFTLQPSPDSTQVGLANKDALKEIGNVT